MALRQGRKRIAAIGVVAVLAVAGAAWWWTGRDGDVSRPAADEPGTQSKAATSEGVSAAATLAGRNLLRLSEQAGVQAVPATRTTLERTVEATGYIVAGRDMTLSFGQAGRLEAVNVEQGQRVRKGDVLAALDPTDRELAYVSARNEYETARAERGPAQVEEKRLAMEAAKRQLDGTRLTAPFDGVVVEVSVEAGDSVTAGAGAVRLVDLDTLKVDAQVDEVDFPFVKAGQTASITVKSYPEGRWDGVVESVGAVGRADGDLVLFDVTVVLESPDARLLPGMSATVGIVVERDENVLAVPEEAVAEVEGQAFVARVVGDRVEPARVTLGVSDGRYVAIRSGISEGDRVLASNYQLYRQLAGKESGVATTRNGPGPGPMFSLSGPRVEVRTSRSSAAAGGGRATGSGGGR